MQQFLKNQVTYDLQIGRLMPWLLGEETLRDRRCLWAHLSTPLNGTNPEFPTNFWNKLGFLVSLVETALS
jgi:cyanosortase A-associated protein